MLRFLVDNKIDQSLSAIAHRNGHYKLYLLARPLIYIYICKPNSGCKMGNVKSSLDWIKVHMLTFAGKVLSSSLLMIFILLY